MVTISTVRVKAVIVGLRILLCRKRVSPRRGNNAGALQRDSAPAQLFLAVLANDVLIDDQHGTSGTSPGAPGSLPSSDGAPASRAGSFASVRSGTMTTDDDDLHARGKQ